MTDFYHPCFLAGVTLAGYVQEDGSVISMSNVKIDDWPKEIEIQGTVFTFESVEFCGREGDARGAFHNAEYV